MLTVILSRLSCMERSMVRLASLENFAKENRANMPSRHVVMRKNAINTFLR